MKNTNIKKIFIASDHAGFHLKELLITELEHLDLDIKLIDLGCDSPDKSVDYPDFAQKLAKKIKNKNDFGILICGSGIGVSIAANRFKHIRAALCHNARSAKLARAHNDANVICLGARFISEEKAFSTVEKFLNSNFEDGRHTRRVEKISK